MNLSHAPKTVAPPFGPYAHGVEVPMGSRIIYTAGEVGVMPDGTVPKTIEEQAECVWKNLENILKHAGFGIKDMVKMTTFLVKPDYVAAAGKARAKYLGDTRPASTTVIVAALVKPEWMIEIEVVAAQR
jgi:enamine deaminase RidA (YjgF/YER057c/UK114 family)